MAWKQRKIVAFVHTYMPDGKWDTFMQGLLDGFVRQSVQVHLIKTNSLVWSLNDKSIARQFDGWKILEFIESVEPDFVLSINRGGITQELIDECPCPILTWLVDITPFTHHAGAKEDLYGNRDFVVTSTSENVALLEKEYPVLRNRVFYEPFATSSLLSSETSGIEKDIPISFVGTLFSATPFKEAFDRYANNPVEYNKLLSLTRALAASFKIDANAEAKMSGLTDALQTAGLSADDFKNYVSHMESSNRRFKLLEALSSEGLHLFGTRNWIDVAQVSLPLFYSFDPEPVDTREKLARIYQRSKISVNISHLQAMGGLPYRIFDIMASNSMLLAGEESRKDLELLFGPDMPLPLYQSPEHARELARHYLAHENERMEIIRKSNAFMRENFSFEDRVQQMFALVDRPLQEPVANDCLGNIVPVESRLFRTNWSKPFYFFCDRVPVAFKVNLRRLLRSSFSRAMISGLKKPFLMKGPQQSSPKGNVTAIVVTYNSDLGFEERLNFTASK
jgi:hypothetical protein